MKKRWVFSNLHNDVLCQWDYSSVVLFFNQMQNQAPASHGPQNELCSNTPICPPTNKQRITIGFPVTEPEKVLRLDWGHDVYFTYSELFCTHLGTPSVAARTTVPKQHCKSTHAWKRWAVNAFLKFCRLYFLSPCKGKYKTKPNQLPDE